MDPELFANFAHAVRGEEQPDPHLVVFNEDLGIEPDLDFLLGYEGGHALGYAGHQFGSFVPQLGDGRAMLLGSTPEGRDIHAKGTGPTPYSRGGDGRGALGPMLREYLMSESLHALGIPTTRGVAVITTGREIMRQFGPEHGAIHVRTAASHLRVGTVQYAVLQEKQQELVDYAIARHYPGSTYAEFFEQVMDAQAATVAQWMRVGFVHGVMNTDNTTLSGETIDYGPCAFTDTFSPQASFSSIDHAGRYRFGNQPDVLAWNMTRLAEALIPLLSVDEASALIATFPQRWHQAWHAELARSLGVAPEDPLVATVDEWLLQEETEITALWRSLVDDSVSTPWADEWRSRTVDRAALARLHPIYIPRNHLVQQAIEVAERGDLGPYLDLLQATTNPYEESAGKPEYLAPAPQQRFVSYCGT